MNKVTIASGTSQQTLSLSDSALKYFGEAIAAACEVGVNNKKLTGADVEQFEFIGRAATVFANQKNYTD